MRPKQLILRCMAQKDGDVWVTSCLDLCLAAQADTLPEAKKKLEDMLSEYVYDALVGEDKAYADQLLSRKAPLPEWVKYYFYLTLLKFGVLKGRVRQLFTESLPLKPAPHCK